MNARSARARNTNGVRTVRVALALGLALLTVAAAGAGLRAAVQVAAELTTKNARTEESNLADVLADAIRDVDHSDAAFIQASALADVTIPKGNATADDFLKALEYRDDSVVIVKLTGAQIRLALEHALELYPQKSPTFLQVSGMTVDIDGSADRDKRVTGVRVGGSAVQPGKTYTVAMPSPLANGALGYFRIWDKKAIDHDTNKTMGQAVTDYVSGARTVGTKGEDRLVIKK